MLSHGLLSKKLSYDEGRDHMISTPRILESVYP